MTNYTVTFVNKTTTTRSFLFYQTLPDINDPNVFSLAWFAKPVAPGTNTQFSWTIDYSFMWSDQGVVQPGVSFFANQVLSADPTGTTGPNKVVFDYAAGAFVFTDPATNGARGTLSIDTSGAIQPGEASIGIGMSGAGTFAVNGYPRDHVMFTPKPRYWAAFGDYTTGDVLDVTEISNPAEVSFSANTYSKTATLGADWIWAIT